MNYYDVLFHPTLIFSSLIYSLMAISFEIAYQHFLHKIEHVTGSYWIAKQIGTPFIHVLLLVAFIYMTYPILYGLQSHNAAGEKILPTLSSLVNAKNGQTMKLINTLFVISILLPLVPIVNRFIALILPLQAIAGSAIVYGWLANYNRIDYSLFPGFKVLVIIILFSILAELAARTLAELFAHSFKKRLNERQHEPYFSPASLSHQEIGQVIYKSALLIFQIPVLLVYTLNLVS